MHCVEKHTFIMFNSFFVKGLSFPFYLHIAHICVVWDTFSGLKTWISLRLEDLDITQEKTQMASRKLERIS